MKKSSFITLLFLLTIGCDSVTSTFDKQIQACVDDIKLGLGDPNSFELLNTEGLSIDNGWFRVNIKYTAKNAQGGRVRGESLCGFKNKNDTQLNPEDFVNNEREVGRFLNKIRK